MWEYSIALEAYEAAKGHFENAEPDYIETAIYELAAAEQRIQATLWMIKEGKKIC